MLKDKIKNGEKTVGMYVQLADISISRIVGLCGYDFIWVDTEHSYISHETMLAHIMALRSAGTPIVVRLPQDDLTATKHILEMGVDGVIFPMVRSAEEANRVISNTLYPPEGQRGFGPMNAVSYGLESSFDYLTSSNRDLCRFIQIEHKDAVDDLDAIMDNEYIDGYIFGPNDLAASYGYTGKPFDENVSEIIRNAMAKLHSRGKYAAIASGGYSEEILRHWESFGSDMLTAGADFDFIRDGALGNRKMLDKIHKNK